MGENSCRFAFSITTPQQQSPIRSYFIYWNIDIRQIIPVAFLLILNLGGICEHMIERESSMLILPSKRLQK